MEEEHQSATAGIHSVRNITPWEKCQEDVNVDDDETLDGGEDDDYDVSQPPSQQQLHQEWDKGGSAVAATQYAEYIELTIKN